MNLLFNSPVYTALWGRDFMHPVPTCPGAHPASCKLDIGSPSAG